MEPKAYVIESELGEIVTYTHKLRGRKQPDYDSGISFFEATGSREKYKSSRMKELMLDYSYMSVRKATKRLNRIRQESGGIKATTYRNTIDV